MIRDKSLGVSDFVSYGFNNLGVVYAAEGNDDMAMKNFQESIARLEEARNW